MPARNQLHPPFPKTRHGGIPPTHLIWLIRTGYAHTNEALSKGRQPGGDLHTNPPPARAQASVNGARGLKIHKGARSDSAHLPPQPRPRGPTMGCLPQDGRSQYGDIFAPPPYPYPSLPPSLHSHSISYPPLSPSLTPPPPPLPPIPSSLPFPPPLPLPHTLPPPFATLSYSYPPRPGNATTPHMATTTSTHHVTSPRCCSVSNTSRRRRGLRHDRSRSVFKEPRHYRELAATRPPPPPHQPPSKNPHTPPPTKKAPTPSSERNCSIRRSFRFALRIACCGRAPSNHPPPAPNPTPYLGPGNRRRRRKGGSRHSRGGDGEQENERGAKFHLIYEWI